LPENVKAWLFHVVRNRAINAARSEARRRHHERYAAMAPNEFASDSMDAIEAAEVAEMLAQLPTEQREVIVARIWGQLSFEQIAELIEASVSTAHRRYSAGIESLRKRMSKPWLTNETS
jgi:RNA polymerase sigma-70 factor (ECF subfamily)